MRSLRTLTVLLGVLASSFLIPVPGSASKGAPPPPPEIALVGGTLVDVSDFGRSTKDVADAVVVVRGGEIVAAGPRRSVKIPAGARRLDVSGKYIVPGLIDSFAALGNQSHANAYLYMGVTSIVGVDGQPRRPALFLKADPSPRIYPLGIVGYGPKNDEFVELGEAEMIAQIEAAARDGAKILLIHYPITPEGTARIVKKARELGLGTIGELGRTTYREAVQAGVPAFVHTSRYMLELASPEMRAAMAQEPFGAPRTEFYQQIVHWNPDDPKLAEYASFLAASPVVLIPTLSTVYLDLPDHRNPWQEPVAKILNPKDLYLAANPATGQRDPVPTEASESFPAGFAESLLRIEERYRRAGVKYLTGSGTTAFGTMPGISLHTEIELLTSRVGLPPRQALAAATSNFGAIFGWKKIGQVKAGYNADLLVLNANPLEDIHNLKNIQTVILNGQILDREKLLAVAH
jgi:imidazolonepropionase-like amidohydrolase